MRNALRTSLISLTVASLFAGCTGGSDHAHHQGYTPPVFVELEPNDSPWHPDFLGGVNVLSHFLVEGYVEAIGFDTVDHFEIVADEPVAIEFTLTGEYLTSDLDLCLFDPDLGVIVASWEDPWSVERGHFTIDYPGKRVVLVVEAWLEDAPYTLEICGGPNPYALTAPDDPGFPAASASPAQVDQDEAMAMSDTGTGISFPDGPPEPFLPKRDPAAPSEEVRIQMRRNQARS